MKLKDKIIIVGGGSGSVGEGIVKELIKEGAFVIVPVRHSTKGDQLKKFIDNSERLVLIDIPNNEVGGIEIVLQQTIKKFNKVDLAIASLGGWYQGERLDQMPTNDWLTVVANNLNSHFNFMKTILGYFHEVNKGFFVMINGGAAEGIAPGAGAMSILANAQLMMTNVLAAEATGTNINIHSVMAITPVKTRARSFTAPDWISATEIGAYIAQLYLNPSHQILHKVPSKTNNY